MREIIHIQGGQCGNQMGLKFWDMIADEHGVDPVGKYYGENDNQIEKIDAYFNEGKWGRYIPRAVLFDFDIQSLDNIKKSDYGQIFKPDNFVHHGQGTNSNYATGFYNEGPCLLEETMDIIRQEAEECESLQGFQLTHSLGGGTGSGVGSLLISKLKDEYSDKIVATFSVIPFPNLSNLEPYNATLSMHHLIENSDFSFFFDNETLSDIWKKYFRVEQPTFSDLNHHMTYAMAGATCTWRFPNQINSDLRKCAINMVPFPRTHFLMVSIAPLTHRGSCQGRIQYSVAELTQQIYDAKNMLCVDPRQGRYLTGCAIYRGQASPSEVHEQNYSASNRNSSYFVEWIPDNIKSTICQANQRGFRRAATFIGNSTSIQQVFKKVNEQFKILFAKQAFLHQYSIQGMDQMEFTEAEANITDLISEYQVYQEAFADDEEEFQQIQEQL